MFRSSVGRVGAAAKPDPGSREAAGHHGLGPTPSLHRALALQRVRLIKIQQNAGGELDPSLFSSFSLGKKDSNNNNNRETFA